MLVSEGLMDRLEQIRDLAYGRMERTAGEESTTGLWTEMQCDERNPKFVDNFIVAFRINPIDSIVVADRRHLAEHGVDYQELKMKQNRDWAIDSVAVGVQTARLGRDEEAIRRYNAAIEFYPEYAEAFVARGAAYTNTKKYSLAVADFEQALRLDSCHSNAKAYLNAVKDLIRKDLRGQESVIKGEFLLPDDFDPNKVTVEERAMIGGSAPYQLPEEAREYSHKSKSKKRKNSKSSKKSKKKSKKCQSLSDTD